MADRKSEEKDKGRDIPTKRFVKILNNSILFYSTNRLYFIVTCRRL